MASNHCLSPDLLRKTVVGTYLPITSPIARSNETNGSADFKMVLHVKVLTALRTLSQLVLCFRKKQYFWHCTPAQTAQTKHTTDKPVIWSAEWSTNDHIYYVRDIGHHKKESINSNVSGTAHQLSQPQSDVWGAPIEQTVCADRNVCTYRAGYKMIR